jgi:hypothetical protein
VGAPLGVGWLRGRGAAEPRRFAVTSLGVIVVIALFLGWLMSNMLTQRMLQREGEVSMDFIQNLLLTDQSAAYLPEPGRPGTARRASSVDGARDLA